MSSVLLQETIHGSLKGNFPLGAHQTLCGISKTLLFMNDCEAKGQTAQ